MERDGGDACEEFFGNLYWFHYCTTGSLASSSWMELIPESLIGSSFGSSWLSWTPSSGFCDGAPTSSAGAFNMVVENFDYMLELAFECGAELGDDRKM